MLKHMRADIIVDLGATLRVHSDHIEMRANNEKQERTVALTVLTAKLEKAATAIDKNPNIHRDQMTTRRDGPGACSRDFPRSIATRPRWEGPRHGYRVGAHQVLQTIAPRPYSFGP